MTPLHLTLLRHGRSRADDEGVHEGRYDSPLTDVGRAQARSLAAYWAAHPPGFDRAYTSTLRRATETAAIVTAPLGLTPMPTDLLREFDNSPLAGLPFAEAEARYRFQRSGTTSRPSPRAAASRRRPSEPARCTP